MHSASPVTPRHFTHRFELYSTAEIDDEERSWLREA
jgi:hypothetical protein